MKFNFRKYLPGKATTYGEPYDKNSVMHYPNNAFAINYNIPVITDRLNPRRQLGQRRGFSTIDIRQINKHYNCKGGTGGGGTKPKPATPRPPVTVCRDIDSRCASWKPAGYCASHPFVRTNCRKTCNLCGGTGGGGNNSCQDKNSSCASWASRGECRRNPGYMKINCCKSCKGGGSTGSCRDSNARCSEWAGKGECSRNPGYMLVNCKKSCRRC